MTKNEIKNTSKYKAQLLLLYSTDIKLLCRIAVNVSKHLLFSKTTDK